MHGFLSRQFFLSQTAHSSNSLLILCPLKFFSDLFSTPFKSFFSSKFSSETMTSLAKTTSSLLFDPLFSTIITLYILILLYFPTLFLAIVFSPVLISTSILLFSLLRLGTIQRTTTTREDGQREKNPISAEFNSADDGKWVPVKSKESSENGLGLDFCKGPSSFYANSFVEWDVRAPLEVIYEEYEGQEDDEDDILEGKRDAQMAIIERYASLSKFYPETDDSDTSSEEDFPVIIDWDPPEDVRFRWEGEDKDGLIEITLEGKGYSDGEEDNLIEIDLSPAGLGLPAR